MRVTNQMLGQNIMRNLSRTTREMDLLQRRLSTGYSILAPSDEPGRTAEALRFRSALDQLEMYGQAADDATAWLTAADSALAHLGEVLGRAKELAVQGSSATNDLTALQAVADEVDQLLEDAVQVGNSTHGDHYLFAGMKTRTAPFTLTAGAVTYNGDANYIGRQVNESSTVTINLTGSEILGTGVFTTLETLSANLRAGDNRAASDRIAEIDAATDGILRLRAEVGARINRMDLLKNRMRAAEIELTNLLSQTEDVDIEKTVIELKLAENAHQVALAVAARVLPMTLVDFLR